jgi:hypothetical protein
MRAPVHALQEQVLALQSQCGVMQSLSSVVRQIWLAYVAKSSILTEHFARCARQAGHSAIYAD